MKGETPISDLEWNPEGTKYIYTCHICNSEFEGGSMEETWDAHNDTDCDERAIIDIFESAKKRVFTMEVEK